MGDVSIDDNRSAPEFASVTARLNHRLMPIDRGERYEDPLNDELEKHGFGTTDGGGTMMDKSKEIEFIDVEMKLSQTEKSIPLVIELLESYGAPKGSKLLLYDGNKQKHEIPFGKAEGVGIYLDGVNLPDEVYESCDAEVVMNEINRLLEGCGSVQGCWQGPSETALYVYGNNAQVMKKLISEYLDTYSLCKGARVTAITPEL